MSAPLCHYCGRPIPEQYRPALTASGEPAHAGCQRKADGRPAR